MAFQSQTQSAPSSPSTSDTEKKRKRDDNATINPAMASFGGYAADEEAEVQPSSHVKSSKKKRKKHKKDKRRHSQIAATEDEENPGTQVIFVSSPSSRKHKRPSTPSGDEEDEEQVNVTPTPKRRRKGSSEKIDRRNIDTDGYDATEEETETEKKRSLIDTISGPRKTQAGDSSGTEHHAETPIRPPPRNHLSNQNRNATAKVTKKRLSRKAKTVEQGNGISSDADSMRTKLSSNISNDMFAWPLARRVAFDSTLAKPKSALPIRSREAVDDEWEETTGKVRGLIHTSGGAEAEESKFPFHPHNK